MKHLLSLILTALFLALLAGCHSAGSLDRRPVKKAPPKKAVRKPAPKKDQDDGQLFDKIFSRTPQQPDIDSKLTPRERELLRRSDVSNDPDVKRLHKDSNRRRQQGKDWVFGTKNGSYF